VYSTAVWNPLADSPRNVKFVRPLAPLPWCAQGRAPAADFGINDRRLAEAEVIQAACWVGSSKGRKLLASIPL